jgi:hypothetical protein
MPSRPGEFHPEPLTDPDLNLSIHSDIGRDIESLRLHPNDRTTSAHFSVSSAISLPKSEEEPPRVVAPNSANRAFGVLPEAAAEPGRH